MTMKEDDNLPGVTLHFEGSSVLNTRKNLKGVTVRTVRLQVIAEITDDTVWQTVESKFKDGLKVYTVDDFKGELLNALREEYKKLEAEAEGLRRANTHLLEENQHMKAGLSVLHQGLERS